MREKGAERKRERETVRERDREREGGWVGGREGKINHFHAYHGPYTVTSKPTPCYLTGVLFFVLTKATTIIITATITTAA